MSKTGNRFTDRTGCKNISNEGYEMEIISYTGHNNMTIKFNDERGTIKSGVAYKEFKNGSIKNPFHNRILGRGYFGDGEYTARVDGKMTKCYNNWFNMFNRCYGEKTTLPYSKVEVDEKWNDYQVFAKWYYENYDETLMKGWDLDKDLLSSENKIYSENTCVFLPQEINALLATNIPSYTGYPRGVYPKDGKFQSAIQKYGKSIYLGFFDTPEEAHKVYMKAKKEYLIEVSEKWRGILSDRVCDAIKNYDLSLL